MKCTQHKHAFVDGVSSSNIPPFKLLNDETSLLVKVSECKLAGPLMLTCDFLFAPARRPVVWSADQLGASLTLWAIALEKNGRDGQVGSYSSINRVVLRLIPSPMTMGPRLAVAANLMLSGIYITLGKGYKGLANSQESA
eukprot:1148579-Pelagomonas_calceolata.AAC.1